MTAEQLELANQLNKKIAQSEKHLNYMMNTREFALSQNCILSSFSISFVLNKDNTGSPKTISFSPMWIEDEEVKNSVLEVLKATEKDLIKLFELDIHAMKQQLNNL